MRERHAPAGIEWAWADIRDMNELKADTIDVAFDKCALDAMIHGSPWSPPDEVLENTGRYIKEVNDGYLVHLRYVECFRFQRAIKWLFVQGEDR